MIDDFALPLCERSGDVANRNIVVILSGSTYGYTAGYDANGKAITKNVLGKTQAEVKDKLRAAIEDSKKLDPVKASSYMNTSY